MDGNNIKKYDENSSSLVGYIALLWQLASFCKGWVGDHCRDHSKCIIAYMDSKRVGCTHPIYIYIYSLYILDAARFGPPQTKFLATPMYQLD